MKKCVYCDANMDESAKYCSNCGKEQPVSDTREIPPSPEPSFSENPFYNEQVPWYERYWNTIKAVMMQPTAFFTSLKKNDDIGKPLMYFMAILATATFFKSVYSFFTTNFMQWFFSRMGSDYGDVNGYWFNSLFAGAGIIPSIVFSLIGGFIGLFVAAGIYHLLLLIFGEGKHGFNATVNAIIFAYTPMVLLVVPIVGEMVAGIWSLVLYIFGIKYMQDVSWGKAVAVVLIPMVLCCCGLIAFGILLAGAFGSNW